MEILPTKFILETIYQFCKKNNLKLEIFLKNTKTMKRKLNFINSLTFLSIFKKNS